MKSSLVSIYVLVFSLLKTDEILNKIDLRKATWWKFNDINLRKISTYKMKEFISNVGKKEEKSANKTITLTEKKLFGNFLLIDIIIYMHACVYTCAMLVSNWII